MKLQPAASFRRLRVRRALATTVVLVVVVAGALQGLRWAFPVEKRVHAALPDSQLTYVRVEPASDGRVNVDVSVEIDNALDAPSVPYEVAEAGYSVVDWVFIDGHVATLRIEYSVFGRPAVVVTHDGRAAGLRIGLPFFSGWPSEADTVAYFSDAASYTWVDRGMWAEATGTGDGAMIGSGDLPARTDSR